MQLRDKVETLQRGLGDELMMAVNVVTQDPVARKTIDKLNRQDPSLNESDSGIAPHDLPKAIHYLTKKILGAIDIHLKELPFLLRTDEILLHSLSVIVAQIFNAFDNKDFEEKVNSFAENIRLYANNAEFKETVH